MKLKIEILFNNIYNLRMQLFQLRKMIKQYLSTILMRMVNGSQWQLRNGKLLKDNFNSLRF